MPVMNALIIAASGILVVFLMLVLLWFIIACINKVVTSIEEKEKAAEVPVIEEVKTAEVPQKKNETYGGEIALYNVDEKTAACIMAIISDTTKIPLNQLIFKSIKALD